MDLLEYQAKELFRQAGIPVLPSQRIDHPRDLKGLKIPYPVVVKSQVYTGGRGKAGGIRFVENTIDAVAAAQTIFHLPIMGQYPEVLLAEAKYEADREIYLAVVLDRSARRPLLLGSQEGGVEIEAVVEKMQRVLVDQQFSPFYARRLALKMGLQGELIQSVSQIVEKMYHLFVQKDLDLVEINPLGINPSGELMALDGKVIANDDALGRHLDLSALQTKIANRTKVRETTALQHGLDFIELDGNIGILCNGAGLTMATLDLIHQAGGKAANFLNAGKESRQNQSHTSLQDRIEKGLELISQGRGIKVTLLNILGNTTSCEGVAGVVERYLQRRVHSSYLPPVVVRMVGRDSVTARQLLAEKEVAVFEDLDAAIAHTVTLSRSKTL